MECVTRKNQSIAAALMLSACSTNYGMYKKGDEEHGQYGYVSTYLAIAAAAIIISSAGGGGGGVYGGGGSSGSGSGSSNSGGSY
ncbi:MAG: hypothetical protein VW950_07765 [Rhodobiaceae bacterium]